RIRVANVGDGPVQDIQVQLPIPSDATVLDTAGADNQGGTLVWTSAELAALANIDGGQFYEWSVGLVLNSPLDNGVVVSAQALVTSSTFAGSVLSDSDLLSPARDATELTVNSQADVTTSIAYFLNPLNGNQISSTQAGENIQIVIEVKNTGDA